LCVIYGVIVADEGAHGFQIRAIGSNYQGFKGRWEGNNPAYANGSSDNLVRYWEARNTMKKSEAAFETWSGKRALENGFINANVTEESSDLVIVEFTK